MIKRQRVINWPGFLFLTLSPVAAVILTYLHVKQSGFLWPIWVLAAVFYYLTAVSITAGYHRLFAHKTYEAKPWLQWFWALFGAASFQNSILIWARDHRVHHRFVDTDDDPYSINRGFWFAHFGWMLFNEPQALDGRPYARDLEKDPIVRFQDKYYVVIAAVMCFGLPTLIGYFLGSALGGLAVAGFLRVFMLHHATFCINSWCHYFGSQRYTDKNTAKDSIFMAVATFGEGYHNFHHFFASDYRNGVRWYHWDPTKWTIRLLSFVGAAESLKRTPWSEIVKAQMQMDELRLKSRWDTQWSTQFQTQLDNLKIKVELAHVRFEELRAEYKKMASIYRQSSIERIEELRYQIRIAKIEFRAALEQWRAYNSFLLKAVPA